MFSEYKTKSDQAIIYALLALTVVFWAIVGLAVAFALN